MMEENNLKWLHLFQKILKPGCSFRDYIEFMATVNPNSKGLDIKSRQAVTILSKKKATAFQETDEGFVKLSTLEKSPEAQKIILDILKRAEENLLNSISELNPKNTCEVGKIQRKFLFGIRNDIKTVSRQGAEKFFRRQKELNSKFIDKERILKEYREYINKEVPKMYDRLMNESTKEFHGIFTEEVELKLEEWRYEQIKILTAALTQMIPDTDYYCAYNGKLIKKISPETGKQQAYELAVEIVNIIYDTRRELYRKFKIQPIGGISGNILAGINTLWKKIISTVSFGYISPIPFSKTTQGQMECGDWSEVLYNNLEEFVANWFMDNINSFAVEWIRRPPLLGESLNSTIFNFKEHNLIRISIGTDNPKYIYIDPWESGGQKLLGNPANYSPNKYDIMNNEDGLKKYPHFKKKKNSYFNGVNEKRGYKFTPRNRNKDILAK